MNNGKYGIDYTVFEYRGGAKIPIINFHAVPGNINTALKVLDDKLGIETEIKEFKERTQRQLKALLEGGRLV